MKSKKSDVLFLQRENRTPLLRCIIYSAIKFPYHPISYHTI